MELLLATSSTYPKSQDDACVSFSPSDCQKTGANESTPTHSTDSCKHNRVPNYIKHILGYSIIFLLIVSEFCQACGPGRAGGRHLRRRRYPPLVRREYFPAVGENTLGASGLAEGIITRHDKRFRELVQNWNPDIEFRDDEQTGADRIMSQRLKEKLSVLAISVMNHWPNVKLRVIEGWDEDYRHSPNSLHYEGRAVDITTSDKDKSKYGMLARLAVEAGFDWVHYESRSHVHCSVKSEKADIIRNNGCFDAKSLVQTPSGQMEMSQLQTNDLVLTMEPSSGKLQFSPVLMWLDRDKTGQDLFAEIKTKSGQLIRLTLSHLIYISDEDPNKQQLKQQVSVKFGAKNVNSDQNDRNYYYYDAQPEKETLNVPAETSSPLDDPRIAEDSSEGDEIAEQFNLDDYVYTTYARNAIVGQYLLIDSFNSTFDTTETKESELPTHNDIIPIGNLYSDILNVDDQSRRKSSNRLTKSQLNRLNYGSNSLTRISDDNYYQIIGDSKVQSAELNKDITMQQNKPKVAIDGMSKRRIKFDQIVSVNYVTREGIYAPLTREGNIVVNSVVASCYALISDHDMAHLSFAPVRWLSYLKELLFGLKSKTPTESRTVEYLSKFELFNDDGDSSTIQESSEDSNDSRKVSSSTPQQNDIAGISTIDRTTINGLERTRLIPFINRNANNQIGRQIHWYPQMLFNLARFILPCRYLY